MNKGAQVLNQFWLKLIAIIVMTLDHIGIFMCLFTKDASFSNSMYLIGYVFRCIGRIAMPLFILFLVEGIKHTSNHFKYLLRIFIIMAIVMVFSMITYYNYSTIIAEAKSPFVDLFLLALTLYLINRKDSYILLSILPIGYILFVTGVEFYESIKSTTCYFLPFYVRPDYSLFGLLLGLGFYASYGLTNRYMKKTTNLDDEGILGITDTPYYRSVISIIDIAVLIFANGILFLLGYVRVIDGVSTLDIYNHSLENWSLLAIPFILMYNGKRGYNSKWFKYGCYLYFPVHIILIFLIFFISFN